MVFSLAYLKNLLFISLFLKSCAEDLYSQLDEDSSKFYLEREEQAKQIGTVGTALSEQFGEHRHRFLHYWL